MKKLVLFLLSFIIIIAMVGCDKRTFYYKGVHKDLYTVAINSLLGINGKGGGEEGPDVVPLEVDNYGRKLFIYVGGGGLVPVGLLICQKSDDKYAYYYPDDNFITVEYVSQMEIEKAFTIEETEQLKLANDWNKEIDDSKCVRVQISSKKKSVSKKKKHFEKVFDYVAINKGYKTGGIYRMNIYCTSDYYGRTLYYAKGVQNDKDSSWVYLAIIFQEDDSYDLSTCWFELVDMYNYQDRLKELKQVSNWNVPIE